MAHYSVIIKNAMVIDGKGAAMRPADIGIELDKIRTIEDLSKSSADLVIDASGKYVMPGFIDITSHSDTHWTLFNSPLQESLLTQGVTTILGGNCGISLAPLARAKAIEGIQKWVDVSQINVNWQTMGEFFSEAEKKSFGVNFATLVGYGTLRRGILGDESRPASYEEIQKIRYLLEEALKQGAFGVSTSLGSSHEKFSGEEEIAEIFKIAKEYEVLTKHHLADEGKNFLPALSRLLSFVRLSGARAGISHFKAIGRTAWENFGRALEMIEKVRNEGFEITCDTFPYTKTGSNLYAFLPSWALEGGKKKILERIRDKKSRGDIVASFKELTLHYERIIVASSERSATSVGKTVQEISQGSGIPPEEIILDLLDANDLRVSIFNEAISEENLDALLTKDYVMFASNGVGYDSGKYDTKKGLAHPRSFGAFPRAFNWLVKEKGLMSWEEAARKMTGMPAAFLGLRGRGVLEVGAFADIAVINPEAIEDRADYKNPYQTANGVDWVLVNGKPAVENGVVNGTMSGKILKRS